MALADGVVYVPIVNAAAQFSSTQIVGQVSSKGTGELDAIDVNTGKILWASSLTAMDFWGATVAGDLVFTSTYTGQVVAFNRSSGHQVWSWQSPVGINSPMTVVRGHGSCSGRGGKQYINQHTHADGANSGR